MDTDWCVACGKHTKGTLYCSDQCMKADGHGPEVEIEEEDIKSENSSPKESTIANSIEGGKGKETDNDKERDKDNDKEKGKEKDIKSKKQEVNYSKPLEFQKIKLSPPKSETIRAHLEKSKKDKKNFDEGLVPTNGRMIWDSISPEDPQTKTRSAIRKKKITIYPTQESVAKVDNLPQGNLESEKKKLLAENESKKRLNDMARTKDFLKNYQKKRSFNQNALSTSNPVSTTEIDPAAFRKDVFTFDEKKYSRDQQYLDYLMQQSWYQQC